MFGIGKKDNGRMSLKEKFLEYREKHKFMKYIANVYVLTLFVVFVWVAFIDRQNIVTVASTYMNIMDQEKTIRKYKASIKETDERMKELSSNKDSLEKFARERFYYHGEDEDVFLLVN